MLKLTSGWLAILALFMLSFSSCDDDEDGVDGPMTITEIAAGDDRFEILTSLLVRVDLDDVLTGTGPFTVFAPTDDAFDGIETDDLTDDEVRQILLYHVLSGTAATADMIPAGQTIYGTGSTAGPNGSQLSLLAEKSGATVTLNGESTVVVADIIASNGVIHAVDEVLFAQSIVDFATKVDALSSLATALTNANLVSALNADGPFTVFAPNNAAFTAAAPTIATLTPAQVADVLRYHVIAGANVRAEQVTAGPVNTLLGQNVTLAPTANNGVNITDASGNVVPVAIPNVQATNGVVHVVGSVLIPVL